MRGGGLKRHGRRQDTSAGLLAGTVPGLSTTNDGALRPIHGRSDER